MSMVWSNLVLCDWLYIATTGMEKVVITEFLPEQSTNNSCLQLPGLVEIYVRN